MGGIQSYPSRTKDGPEVDFSTGSVGLGVALTSFAALMQDYVRLHGLDAGLPPGRHVAIAGDAELDEGNIYEALLEGWKHDIRNVWWIIDYNRQSLDSVVPDRLFGRIEGLFRDMGWNVVTLKYGRLLQAAFERPGGEALRRWIDDCPNSLYSALAFQGGAAWRVALLADLGRDAGVRAILDPLQDDELATLMTNLGGHDVDYLIEQFRLADAAGDQPTCFIAYTMKGMGLPFAGHKDNHSGLMTRDQMEAFRTGMRIRPGHEWDVAEGLDLTPGEFQAVIDAAPFAQKLTPDGPVASASASIHIPDACRFAEAAGRQDQHPGRLRRHPGGGRAWPGRARRDGPAHRHHQPGRDGQHQPRPVGQPARGVRPAYPQRRVPRRQAGQRATLGHGARRASISSWASPSRTCSCCWPPRACSTA